MNFLNDIIYFSYITSSHEEVIKQFYKFNHEVFFEHLNQLFDVEFKNTILSIVKEPLIEHVEETQYQYNAIFKLLSLSMHERLSNRGREYWNNRGVTDAQIEEFYLGDNEYWVTHSKEFTSFCSYLQHIYPAEIVEHVRLSYANQVLTSIRLYGDAHSVVTPSFSEEGECKGLVWRITEYKKENVGKNVYKFYNPYSYSYLFNFKDYQKYDELYVVEGVFDALALHRFGIHNVISPSMVRISPWHVRLLKKKKLHILFDLDNGGYSGLRFFQEKLPASCLATLALCPTNKDFDEMNDKELDYYFNHLKEYDIRNILDL